MKCKNCDIDLNPDDNYCCYCGAKIINERITLNHLLSDFISSLGWDSQFWATTRDLIVRPRLVFDKYLNGTRKKYSNPFTFFAIVTTITVLTIGFYTNEMIELSTKMNFSQSVASPVSEPDKTNEENINQSDSKNLPPDSQVFMEKLVTSLFKYYYYISFLLLPFFTFIAFLVFGKPDNFAEHLIINSFILGLVGILGLLLFPIALMIKSTEVYYWGQYAITIIYYSYAYKNYRNYSLKQLVIKILRFIAVVLILSLIFSLIVIVIAIIIMAIKR
ncbi:MAG: DUF3667 domain-containing protein [Ignavibacteriales bacterium]|nr:DUF3667 domain-containing protein [Ignavibacteriales bacterium]